VSSLEPLREQITAWYAQGVSGVVIHTALKREHGYTGSYSAVRRLLATLKREALPETTVRLAFAPGEAAQVDFGAGEQGAGGVVRRTWAFVMTLCFSRQSVRRVRLGLPAVAPDLGVWSQASVHRDCHVQFERAFYSAPYALVGQRLWLNASDGSRSPSIWRRATKETDVPGSSCYYPSG